MIKDDFEEEGHRILERAGKEGRFQNISCIFILGYSFIVFYNITALPLQKIRPKAMCRLKGDVFQNFRYCTEETYCDVNYEKKIIREESINNWALDFNVDCEQEKEFDFIISGIFFGAFLSYVILSVWADKNGRKKVLEFEIYGITAVIIIALFSFNLEMICFLWFLYEFFNHVYSLLMVYATETMSQEYFAYICSLGSISFPLTGLINSLLLFTIKDWRIVHLIYTIFCIIFAVIFKFFVVESPVFCLEKRDLKGFIVSVTKISNVNKTFELIKNDLEDFEKKYSKEKQINTLQKKLKSLKNSSESLFLLEKSGHEFLENKISFIDYFKTNEIFRMEFIIIVFVYSVVQLVFFGVLLNIEKFDDNVLLFSILLYTSEIIAEFLSGYLAQKWGRVIVLKLSFYIAGGSFFFFQFTSKYFITRVLFLFFGNFGISSCYNVIVIYMAEVFDVKIRATASSYCRIPSQLVIVFSPYILSRMSYPFVFFAVLCISSGYLIEKCHETLCTITATSKNEYRNEFVDEDKNIFTIKKYVDDY